MAAEDTYIAPCPADDPAVGLAGAVCRPIRSTFDAGDCLGKLRPRHTDGWLETSSLLSWGVGLNAGCLSMEMSLPDVRFLEQHFEFPAARWVDACYPLAHSIVRELHYLNARVVEGVWTGIVAEATHFRWLVDQLGAKEMAHWWLELPDGRVMDPTRWVFEGVEPYVYYGPPDHYIEKRLGRVSGTTTGR